MNQRERLPQNPISIFMAIDSEITVEPTPYGDNACITNQNAIIEAILENNHRIPVDCILFTCGFDSTHTPHHWIEIVIPQGTFIWDRTDENFTGTHFLPVKEAKDLNLYYSKPSYRLQFYPDYEE